MREDDAVGWVDGSRSPLYRLTRLVKSMVITEDRTQAAPSPSMTELDRDMVTWVDPNGRVFGAAQSKPPTAREALASDSRKWRVCFAEA